MSMYSGKSRGRLIKKSSDVEFGVVKGDYDSSNNYNNLINKPTVNGVELVGDVTVVGLSFPSF